MNERYTIHLVPDPSFIDPLSRMPEERLRGVIKIIERLHGFNVSFCPDAAVGAGDGVHTDEWEDSQ